MGAHSQAVRFQGAASETRVHLPDLFPKTITKKTPFKTLLGELLRFL